MKVHQLINELKKLNQHHEVYFQCHDQDEGYVDGKVTSVFTEVLHESGEDVVIVRP